MGPRNNRLTQRGQLQHRDQPVVDNDYRIPSGVAFFFLAVCLLNTVGLLLAKFLNDAALTGIRRGCSGRAAAITACPPGRTVPVRCSA